MPQWAGSSWYFLRYMDPHNDKELVGKDAIDYWGPVDWYNGGMEHTTLHLLYSRFWHKFLYDIGVVPYKEPYAKRTSHGMILGLNPHSFVNMTKDEQQELIKEFGSEENARKALVEKYGEMAEHPIVKMSKSLGNVVNPDDIVRDYGADTLRLYEMFIGDFEQAAPWSTSSIKGCRRFIEKVWQLQDVLTDGDEYSPEFESAFHRTIKKVGTDIESLKANTAIAALMSLVNEIGRKGTVNRAEYRTLLILCNPFIPHMTEEAFERCGFGGQISQQKWPEYDEAKCIDNEIEMPVQINGKLRGRITVPFDSDNETVLAAAKADDKVAQAVDGKMIVKEIVVKNKLVNIVVK